MPTFSPLLLENFQSFLDMKSWNIKYVNKHTGNINHTVIHLSTTLYSQYITVYKIYTNDLID